MQRRASLLVGAIMVMALAAGGLASAAAEGTSRPIERKMAAPGEILAPSVRSAVAADSAVVKDTAAAKETAVVKDTAVAPDSAASAGPLITRLKNGLTVLVLRDTRFPLVSTRLYVHAGAAWEKPDQAGISHLLEHMVFKGTEHRPKGAVSREVEAAGGYLNAATGYDYTVYLTDMPARHWKLGLDVARDMAFNATLNENELESEKQVVLSELDMRMKDNPQGRLFERLLAETLRGTPYERPVIGFPETLQGISIQDMRDYVSALYQPRNMLLVVVGEVEPDEVLAEAERLFGPYENRSPIPVPVAHDPTALSLSKTPVVGAPPAPVVVVQPGPWNKVYFSAAFPVPGFADFRTTPLDVLAYLLGGDNTSLLYRLFKYERQLVDSISAFNMSFERVGLFVISAELGADKVESFWQELTRTLATLDPANFTAAEIERARLNLEDDFYRARETLGGLASKLGYLQFFLAGSGGVEQAEANVVNAVRAVDARSLVESLNWLDPARMRTVVLPPQGSAMPDFAAVLEKNWPGKPRSAQAAVDAGGETEIVDLGQGCRLVLIPDDTMPYISADLAYSGGETLLAPEDQGLAALTALLISRGTSAHSAPEIRAFLSDRAAALGASAGRQSFTVSFTAPSRFNEDLFALLRETLTAPAFSAEETARGIREQVAAIEALPDQPLRLVFREMGPFLFPGSVQGYRHLGEADTVKSFTQGQIRAFWDRQKTRPFVLSVAGSFDREAVIAFAKSLPQPSQERVELGPPAWGQEKTLDLSMPGRNQAHLLLVFRTVPDDAPEAPALELMAAILSGMGGPLFRELRDEQGLGYTVTAFNRQSPQMGYTAFYIGTTPDKVGQAEEGFRKILAELAAKPLPKDDLERGCNQLEGDYYRGLQSLGSRSGEAVGLVLHNRPLSFTRDQIEKARAVTPEDLLQLARRFLRFEDAYVVKALPAPSDGETGRPESAGKNSDK